MIDGSLKEPLGLLLRRQIGNFFDFVVGKLGGGGRLRLVPQLEAKRELVPGSADWRGKGGGDEDQDQE
jgi:hypothetical protein